MSIFILYRLISLALSVMLFFVFGGPDGGKTSSGGIIEKYFVRAKEPRVVERRPPEKPASVNLSAAPAVEAQAFLVKDIASGAILESKNADKIIPLASLTKLMTALIAVERGADLDEIVEIGAKDRVGGDIEYFLPGDKVKFRDLLAAALIASSNTAANVIAKKVSGMLAVPNGRAERGGENFVNLMNERARLMNFKNTGFADPTGIDPQNISTAGEAVRFASLAFARQEIREILTKSEYGITVENTGRKIVLKNTDRLLGGELDRGDYQIIGGKTGYLDESGYNLALRVARGGNEIIVIILGSKSSSSRFAEAKDLALWAFENFRWP